MPAEWNSMLLVLLGQTQLRIRQTALPWPNYCCLLLWVLRPRRTWKMVPGASQRGRQKPDPAPTRLWDHSPRWQGLPAKAQLHRRLAEAG